MTESNSIRHSHNFKDLSGKQFGRLKAVRIHSKSFGMNNWLCICVCGKETIVNGGNLRKLHTQSCGCLQTEKRTIHGHGRRKHRSGEYRSYHGAKNRCNNPNCPKYRHYGGRGIEFRFSSFDQFLAEVGEKPTRLHSIDRIDNEGHYEPGNVKWSTQKEQIANRRKFIHRQ